MFICTIVQNVQNPIVNELKGLLKFYVTIHNPNDTMNIIRAGYFVEIQIQIIITGLLH